MIRKNLLYSVLAAFAVVAIIVFLVPSPIEPAAWRPAPTPKQEGALRPNALLADAELLGQGKLQQPEDIAFDEQGRLYAGNGGGTIQRFDPERPNEVDSFATTGGHPLGLQFDGAGNLIAAVKEVGLLSITPDGTTTVLTDRAGDAPITYANEVAISAAGTIYFTDSSTKFDLGWPFDILEAKPYGRLLSYDPRSKTTAVLLDGLYFPNGVVLSAEENYLLLSETSRYRILRYWLSGPKAGTTDVFADNLPNLPDNLSMDANGDVWVGGSQRIGLVDFLQPRPFLKKQLAKLPYGLLKKIPTLKKRGYALRLGPDGTVEQAYYDPVGNVYGISSVVRKGDALYLGTLFGDAIGRYRLEE